MRKTRKLQVPNQRSFIERQILGQSDAMFRFAAGHEEEQGHECNTNPCEHGWLVSGSLHYQSGDVETLSGSATAIEILTSGVTISGSSGTYFLPTIAYDVSGVWLDNMPTDVWDFVPEDNTIVFPESLIVGTKVYVRYINNADE